VALVALVIFGLFVALALPAASAVADAASQGAGSPDLSFFYSVDELYRMAEAYGEEGRRVYVTQRFTFDLIWPLVYMAFLVTAISWVNARAFPEASPWQRVNLVPVLGMLLDYLENISSSLVMLRYPELSPLVGTFATLFTPVKWALVGASFVLLVVGIAAGVWRWVHGRRDRRGSRPRARG
jgi:hypothetical protein